MNQETPATNGAILSRRPRLPGGVLAANMGLLSNVHAQDNNEVIRVGLVGCGGRGTGAAEQCLAAGPQRPAGGHGRRLPRSRRMAACNAPAATIAASAPRWMCPTSDIFVGLDAYQQRHRELRPGDPGHAARFPADAHPRRGRRPQARLHREAGRRRWPRRPHRACKRSRRPTATACRSSPARSAATRPATSNRCSASTTATSAPSPRRRCYWNQGAPLAPRPHASDDRPRMADPQLALLHLAVRRPHRRAARPQPRRHQLGPGQQPSRSSASGMGGRQVRTGRRVRPHLRPLRRRLRISQRRPRPEHVPADRGLRATTSPKRSPARAAPGPRNGRPNYTHHRRTRLELPARARTTTPTSRSTSP